MKLFDGSENYEIRDFGVFTSANRPTQINLRLNKNTNCNVQLEPFGGTKVLHIGPGYSHPEINRYSIALHMSYLGHFMIHATNLRDSERIVLLKKTLEIHPRAELTLSISLIGDEVKSEPQLAAFEVKAKAEFAKWSYMFHDNSRQVFDDSY